MDAYLTYLKGLRGKAVGGGIALLIVGVGLWIAGKIHPGRDYSQVVVGGTLFVCGTICLAIAKIADMLDGLAKSIDHVMSPPADESG